MATMEEKLVKNFTDGRRFLLIFVVMTSLFSTGVLTDVIHVSEGIQIFNVTMETDTYEVSLGELNNMTINVTVHADTTGHVTSCCRWKVGMWISQRPDGDGEKLLHEKLKLSTSQKSQPLTGNGPLVFSNLVYGLNLKSTPCREIMYLCTSLRVSGNNSQTITCQKAPRCRDGLLVRDVKFTYETNVIAESEVNLTINVTVDYDRQISGDVMPSTIGCQLWRVLVWMSESSRGTEKRHSLVRNVIPSGQSWQNLIVGEELSFTNMPYSFNADALNPDQIYHICIRFKLIPNEDYMILSRPNSGVRTQCLEGPSYNVTVPDHTELYVERAALRRPTIAMKLPDESTANRQTLAPNMKEVSWLDSVQTSTVKPLWERTSTAETTADSAIARTTSHEPSVPTKGPDARIISKLPPNEMVGDVRTSSVPELHSSVTEKIQTNRIHTRSFQGEREVITETTEDPTLGQTSQETTFVPTKDSVARITEQPPTEMQPDGVTSSYLELPPKIHTTEGHQEVAITSAPSTLSKGIFPTSTETTRTPDQFSVLVNRLSSITGDNESMTQRKVDDVIAIMKKLSLFENIPEKIVKDVFLHMSNFIDTKLEPASHPAPLSNVSHLSEHLNQILDNVHLADDDGFRVVFDNIRVSSFELRTPKDGGGSPSSFGQVYPIGSYSDTMIGGPIDIDTSRILQDGVEAGFFIPGDALPLQEDALSRRNTTVRVNFIVFSNSHLFDVGLPEILTKERPFDTSRVTSLDVTVNGHRMTSLNKMISLAFKAEKASSATNRSCVWWDFALNGGNGDWSPEGCEISMETPDYAICNCDHLTNFAVLMMPIDESSQPGILDTITDVGCVLSIVSLVFTLLTYLTFKKLMPATAQLVLIQWVVALLCLYVVFFFGIDNVTNGVVCQVVAALLHFFTLSFICWTSVEALHMYFVLVQTMNGLPRTRKFIPWSSAYAWGCPLIVVAVSLSISGGGRQVYELEKFCFLKQADTFYYFLLIPIGAILLFNVVCYLSIVYRINFTRPKVTMMRRDRRKIETATAQTKQAATIAILVGVTWVVGFFAIEGHSFIFSLVFCICNTLTGVFVFLLFCVLRKEVRQKWRDTFLCGSCCPKDDQFRRRGFSDTSSTLARQSCTVRTHSITLEFMPKTMIVDLSSPTISDCLASPLTEKSGLI